MRFDTLPDGDGWLAIDSVPCDWTHASIMRPDLCGRCDDGGMMLPAEVLALLKPCETCEGRGWDLIRPIGDDTTTLCPDCVEGRRKFDVETPCDHLGSEYLTNLNFGDGPVTGCDRCKSTRGTITRTFTVGEHGLFEVGDWPTPIVVHGVSERTTHALHVSEFGL